LFDLLKYSNAILLYVKSRFETVDMTVRLLIPIIVLQNHNRYNILQAGHNYSIDVQAIEREVSELLNETSIFYIDLTVSTFLHSLVKNSCATN
jgi:hypothetical protein